MRRILVVLLFGSTVNGHAQDAAFPDLKDDRSLIRTRILSNSAFDLTAAERLARQFLDDAGPKRALARLSMYDRRDVAIRESGGMCEGTYLRWRAQYDSFPKRPLIAADVISVTGNAALRLRSRDGSVTRQVLRGTDPTQIVVGGASFDILYITGRVRSRFEGCGMSGTIDPVLFLKAASVLSPAVCQRVTSWLAAKLGVRYLWTEFRNDHWFVCSQFPVVFPFSRLEPLPPDTVLADSPGYGCSIPCEGPASCLSTGRITSAGDGWGGR
jgi:hypothetical protein